MQNLRKLVHSPHHLFVFEVSARLLSFTRAAQELGVSQPAVSLAVRQLEQAIGQTLFQRGHRQIKLTTAGERFYGEVSIGLGRILNAAEELKNVTPPAQVTLSVSTAFANYWMMPRLSALHRNHPEIDLRLQVVDKDIDLENENVSLGIRRGTGNWSGYQCACIAVENLVPVASAAYLASQDMPATVEDLYKLHLIHLEEPYRPRPTWQDWFRYFSVDFIDQGEGLRLNDYALVIQAAMSGEGVAMGWRHIVDPLINRGLLVQVLPLSWLTGEKFYVIWSGKSTLSAHARHVRDWIINQAKSQSSLT